ncbi:MAG: VIT domain-containing protein, partial [Polyangiaceae bacterium]
VAFWQDWTGGMGDQHGAHGAIGSGSGRLYGLDPNAPAGVPAQKLGIAKQVVKAVVRDGIAETEVDQTFSNPGAMPIEGWYWFTVPPTATISSFAVETNGVLVEGEVVEKREAAARYAAAVHQAYDPALLEWVDGRTYRARIYPLPASGTRRVVLRYVELLPSVEGKMRYVYPLRSDDPVRFDEFSLSVDVGATSADIQTATSLDAITESSGKLVTMRRSGYLPRADFQLEMTAKKRPKPMRAWRFNAGADQADYVMLRYVPEVDFTALPPARGELVLVVDTSAGGDESARQLRISAAEAILRALSDDDKFAVVAVDVSPTVVYPKEGLAKATDTDIAEALEKLNDHGIGGATDLGAMFEPALERLHNADQPAIVYVGDGAPTSGETTADGLTERLRRSLSGSRARFFAVGVGSDTHHELLGQLTLAGGGQYLRIDEPEQTTGQALRLASAIKTPTITDLEVDLGAGLDQPFYSSTGKLSRCEEMVLLARTHHALPSTVNVKGRVGQKDQTWSYPITVENSVTTALVPRLWASEYMRRLLGSGSGPDENRAKVLSLGIEYGLMTPYTSILALDSEMSYARQGVPRRNSRLRGVRLTSLDSQADEDTIVRGLAPPLPRTMAGCDNKSAPSASESTLDDKQSSGATGTRAKGEEGAMGSPASPAMQAPSPAATAANQAQSAPVDLSAAVADEPSQPNRGSLGGLNGIGAGTGAGGGGRAGNSAGPQGMAKAASSPPPPPVAPRPSMRAGPKTAAIAEDKERDGLELGGKLAEKDQKQKKALDGDRQRGEEREDPAEHRRVARQLSRCSDSASRPLAERMVLWQKRLKQVTLAAEVAAQYDMALAYCELPDWRDQAAFLDLVQQRVDNEGAAQIVLAHFAGEDDAQKFLARRILRRTVDIHVAAAVSRVIFGEIDWMKVDRQLFDIEKPEARLLKLRTAMLAAPGDPAGDVRLVKLLAQTGAKSEAISYGRRLRDRGLLTPSLAQQLGDVLADAGENDEALRTYSEVVEFDGNNPASRKVLGDIYLRRGWFTAAYRQYKTLTDLDARNPLAWLRLADSAAGAGRIDEALRIEREVATGEGSPGPNDPRYFARLWSAARLGILLGNPAPNAPAGSAEAIHRKLKELQLFSGPGTLALVVWNDLDARLSLAAADEKKEALAGETTDAGVTGLYSLLASNDTWEKTARAVRWKADAPGRSVKYKVVALTWDGKKFWVKIKDGELKPEVLKEAI